MNIGRRYSVQFLQLKRGAWQNAGSPSRGLTRGQADEMIEGAREPCTSHSGPCAFPFRICNRGVVALLELEG